MPIQPITAAPRAGLTAAQVTWLLQGSPSIRVGNGCEVTDLRQDDVEDMGDDFGGGQVERQSYASLHGGADLLISRVLPWGYAVVRPYMTLSDGDITARFNLGAYFTTAPIRATGESLTTYRVQCLDILYGLDITVGASFGVPRGSLILDAVEQILIQRGYTKYIIDQSRADAVTPDIKTWAMDVNVHWLHIVNDLLGMIGYQGIWSDWDGNLRCEPYQRPKDRGYEWYLPADAITSILGPAAEVEYDFTAAPNRWVGVRSNNPEDAAPVEGDGVYTYTNDLFGPTSVEGRGSLVITRMESLDVASQADLVTKVLSMADGDMSVPTRIRTTTNPFPLAWHFDRYLIDDVKIGPASDVLGVSWTLPLNGDDMSHTWTALNGVVS